IAWENLGLPLDFEDAARKIERAWERARAGELVEIGCQAGLGRTGTAIACMAILSGVEPRDAVAWVGADYAVRAVDTRLPEGVGVCRAQRAREGAAPATGQTSLRGGAGTPSRPIRSIERQPSSQAMSLDPGATVTKSSETFASRPSRAAACSGVPTIAKASRK